MIHAHRGTCQTNTTDEILDSVRLNILYLEALSSICNLAKGLVFFLLNKCSIMSSRVLNKGYTHHYAKTI